LPCMVHRLKRDKIEKGKQIRCPYTVTVVEGISELEAGILNDLQTLIVSGKERKERDEIIEDFEEVTGYAPTDEKKMDKRIKELVEIIGELDELKSDTDAVRLHMDKLLKVYERRWTKAVESN